MSIRLLHLLLFPLVLLGVYLRINQFSAQVLMDDEWHAVHQLLSGKTPRDLFFTLGIADYSMPLGMLYYWLSQCCGLSEFTMRLPMLVASLLALVGGITYVWQRFSPCTTLGFALLLALSPLLVIYAHTARPYALTFLLSYLALFAFYHYWNAPRQQWLSGVIYILCAGLCLWLHLISGPFLVAPFVLEGVRALVKRNRAALRHLTFLGLPTAALMILLVLPAIITDPQALTSKSGQAAIGWNTAIGVWFTWFGSGSAWSVAFLFGCAALGLRCMLLRDPLLQAASLGVSLTLVLVLATQPQWVQHPITMGRYLLPIIPLLLLATACGMASLLDWSVRVAPLRLATAVAIGAMLIGYVVTNPSWRLVTSPSSQLTHSLFQFDFRPGRNLVAQYQEKHLRQSPFWSKLALAPTDSLHIAVAPFYFETYNWDAPNWERTSAQRVFPAYLTGFCVQNRHGEVPDNTHYRFRNAYYVEQLRKHTAPPPDWLVFTRPFIGFSNGLDNQLVGEDTQHCLAQLQEEFGEPDYQDNALVAWHLSI